MIPDVITDSFAYVRNWLRGNWDNDANTFEGCTPEKPPILLLHGFLGTRGALFVLEQRLAADGFAVFSIDLGALNINDIRKSAYRIHLEVERILEAAGDKIEKIDIVGHSMGGLIGLYYAQSMGGHERVRKLVTLGTPFQGTLAALAGVASPLGLVSPSTWQMVPGSDLLREIKDRPVPLYVELASVFGRFDVLCPPYTAQRDDAVNFQVSVGHGGLTVSQDVYRIIRRVLNRPHHPGRDAGRMFELHDGRFDMSVLREVAP